MGEQVGIAEIAVMAGRPKQTVWHWTQREGFPKSQQLQMGPVWNRTEVEEWLKSNEGINA